MVTQTAPTNGNHASNGAAPHIDLQTWRDAVAVVTQRALDYYGEDLAGRIHKARHIILVGLIHPGREIAHVVSESDPEMAYEVTSESCTCLDTNKAPRNMCKHRLAWQIYRGAYGVAKGMMTTQIEASADSEASDTRRIPAGMIVDIRGKQFVTYAGLLALAQRQGLQSLDVRFLDVQTEFATAIATATFVDGRCFTECGDACPGNVNPNIRPHFARMALTRAKARCLRDALNIGMCAVEELAE